MSKSKKFDRDAREARWAALTPVDFGPVPSDWVVIGYYADIQYMQNSDRQVKARRTGNRWLQSWADRKRVLRVYTPDEWLRHSSRPLLRDKPGQLLGYVR